MPTPRRSPPPRRRTLKPPPPTRQPSGGCVWQPRRDPASCRRGRRGVALGQLRWRRLPESRTRQVLPSSEPKRFSPSPAASTAGYVVFPPLQLRWRPILRAFLPCLPREPRRRPQSLTSPLLPRKPEPRPLVPTLSHNQRRVPLLRAL